MLYIKEADLFICQLSQSMALEMAGKTKEKLCFNFKKEVPVILEKDLCICGAELSRMYIFIQYENSSKICFPCL